MRILIIGAGKMGVWLADTLSLDYEVAVYEKNPRKLRYLFNVERFATLDEIDPFLPELCINAVTLNYTIAAFNEVIPHLPDTCIVSDIASVKYDLADYYAQCQRPFVSSHPMFGPTFASLNQLASHSAIIITESNEKGIQFFKQLYRSLELKVYEYSFEKHDEVISQSLTIPFTATFLFTSCVTRLDAPGTTFQKHMNIADGLLSEDDYLISEILFNPFSMKQLGIMSETLQNLMQLVATRDEIGVKRLLSELRENIK